MSTLLEASYFRQRLRQMEPTEPTTFGNCDVTSYFYIFLSVALTIFGSFITVVALGGMNEHVSLHLGHMWLVGPVFICSGMMMGIRTVLYLRRKSVIQMLLRQRALLRIPEDVEVKEEENDDDYKDNEADFLQLSDVRIMDDCDGGAFEEAKTTSTSIQTPMEIPTLEETGSAGISWPEVGEHLIKKEYEEQEIKDNIAKVEEEIIPMPIVKLYQSKDFEYQIKYVTVVEETMVVDQEHDVQYTASDCSSRSLRDVCMEETGLGNTGVFVKKEVYDFQLTEGCSEEAELKSKEWSTPICTDGHDIGAGGDGFNREEEHSISPGKSVEPGGDKPFSCELCDYKCARQSHLKSHLRTHTSDKPYSCEFCDYKCAGQSNLKRHLRTHTGDKPFSCELCDYKCAEQSNLKRHLRTHSGDKPFSCEFCDYKCAEQSNLKRHLRTHTGDKPFSCEFCDYKCAEQSNLKRHLRTHAGD